jgi:hypothetical protein
MRPQTATKLAIAAVIAILFAGFILRAAMKLAATAMHSILGAIVIVLLVAWVVVKAK